MTRIQWISLIVLLTLLTLTACETSKSLPATWNAVATASPGFSGAGANVTAATDGARRTDVTVTFREAPGVTGTTRPWHLHYGRCGNDEGIVGLADRYSPLQPGPDGTATSSAAIPVPLTLGRSYFINIHESPANLSRTVACGDLSVDIASIGTAVSSPAANSSE
jgi:hypothetical protein